VVLQVGVLEDIESVEIFLEFRYTTGEVCWPSADILCDRPPIVSHA